MDEIKNYPPYLDYPKPQENTNYIRAMSDEEALAASKSRMFMAFSSECPVCGHKTNMPQSNADKIRAMSDEELADVLREFCKGKAYCIDCPFYRSGCPMSSTFNDWVKWLQRPVEGE